MADFMQEIDLEKDSRLKQQSEGTMAASSEDWGALISCRNHDMYTLAIIVLLPSEYPSLQGFEVGKKVIRSNSKMWQSFC